MTNLEKQLALVLDGRITYGAFVSTTRREFTAMACFLARRWIPPTWMVPDDIAQELYLGAWLAIWGYDPTRGKKLGEYVVYNAMSYAKRALHKARGAKLSGSADRNPSNIERPLASFGDDGEALAEMLLAQEPAAEQVMIDAEHRSESVERALQACETSRERVAILAISEAGDVDSGGRLLYDDLDTRIALRLGSEEHAARYITHAAGAVARRLDALAAAS